MESIVATLNSPAEDQVYVTVFTEAEEMIILLEDMEGPFDGVFPPLVYLASLGVHEDLPPFWKLRKGLLRAACEIATREYSTAAKTLINTFQEWGAARKDPRAIREDEWPAVSELMERMDDYFIVIERGMYSLIVKDTCS
jgi:hypothetical protein